MTLKAQSDPHQELYLRLGSMSRAELDHLDVGVVQLDETGKILFYNRAESRFSGMSPGQVVGRNFFSEVAPCTNNGLVYRPFLEGMAKGELNLNLDYTFTFKMRPTNVRLHLYRDRATRTNWLLVYADQQQPNPT